MSSALASRRKTKLLAAAVLAGGLGLALTFYRAEPQRAALERSEEPIRRRLEDGPRFLMEVRSYPPANAPQAEAPAAPDRRPMDALAGLPLFEATGEQIPRIAADHPAAGELASVAPAAPRTFHRVVDGDTLPDLARRYLGDASRAPEIYDLNRDALASPDLLPIGAVLKIPPG